MASRTLRDSSDFNELLIRIYRYRSKTHTNPTFPRRQHLRGRTALQFFILLRSLSEGNKLPPGYSKYSFQAKILLLNIRMLAKARFARMVRALIQLHLKLET